MGEVKRYDPVSLANGYGLCAGAAMAESVDGGYVRHSDYETLRSEVERLRKIERAAKAMIDAGLADIDDAERAYDALAEACGRKG